MKPKQISQLWLITIAMIALLALSAAPSYASTVYDSAVSYWSLDDNTSNTTIADSKNTNPGTFNDPTGNPNTSAHHTTGRIGGAMTFDGTNDYIRVPDSTSLHITNTITASLWFKTSAAGSWPVMMGKLDNGYRNGFDMCFYGTTTNLRMEIAASSYAPPGTSGVNYKDGAWHNMVGTYDGSNAKIYVDGILQVTFPYTGGLTSNTNPLTIGNEQNAYWYSGLIDEVAIWNSALTQDQITAIYDTGYIADATSGWGLVGYGTSESNQLADLYARGKAGLNPDPITINGTTWQYYATLPDQVNHTIVGESYTYNGKRYIYLGSGIGEPLDSGVPEPAAIMGLASMMLAFALRRRFSG